MISIVIVARNFNGADAYLPLLYNSMLENKRIATCFNTFFLFQKVTRKSKSIDSWMSFLFVYSSLIIKIEMGI